MFFREGHSQKLHELSRVEREVSFIPYFEDDLGGGYCRIDAASFNWNWGRRGTVRLEPFGRTKGGLPLKRDPAQAVLKDLKDARKREERIEKIAHRGLRELLSKSDAEAPGAFVKWLQQTTAAGLRNGNMSGHPSDQARRSMLERFCRAEVSAVLSGEVQIPHVIGVRCVAMGSVNKVDVARVDGGGKVIHRYQAQPVIRRAYVGYARREGTIDRARPVVLGVKQSWELQVRKSSKWRAIEGLSGESPLRGRALGSRGREKEFLSAWNRAFQELCTTWGLEKVFVISQGCVIEKEDGSRFMMRNFDKTKDWCGAEAFKNIRRVYRSPLGAVAQSGR